ncbi:hypothetical protein ACXN5S_08960 [Pseudoroseicyclus sp. H15]
MSDAATLSRPLPLPEGWAALADAQDWLDQAAAGGYAALSAAFQSAIREEAAGNFGASELDGATAALLILAEAHGVTTAWRAQVLAALTPDELQAIRRDTPLAEGAAAARAMARALRAGQVAETWKTPAHQAAHLALAEELAKVFAAIPSAQYGESAR